MSLDIVRYQPLTNPVDGPPQEYRGELYPFTTWTLSLTKSSHAFGFSSLTVPIFDPSRSRLDGTVGQSTPRPRLVGIYEEWGIPFWFIFLSAAILPAAYGIRHSITNYGRTSAVSFARAFTLEAFLLFLVAGYDRGWSADFEAVLSLLLAGCGLVMGTIFAIRNRRWQPAGLNAAYWAAILLVHWMNR